MKENEMKEQKKIQNLLIFLIGITICISVANSCWIFILNGKIKSKESITVEEEVVDLDAAEYNKDLDPCRKCGSDNVEVYPVHDSWVVRCQDCRLEMEFFDSKEEAITIWNGGRAE